MRYVHLSDYNPPTPQVLILYKYRVYSKTNPSNTWNPDSGT